MRTKIIFILCILTVSISCKKTVDPERPQFTSFKLEATKNPDLLAKDLEAFIKEDTIFIEAVQQDVLSQVVVTYETNAQQVLVNGETQKSGESKVDLKNNLTYTLIDDAGAQRSYIIKLLNSGGTGAFTGFSLLKGQNPTLNEDVIFGYSGDTLLGLINKEPSAFVPTFSSNGATFYINNVEQVSGTTPVDFSQPVYYTVISDKGFKSTQLVYLRWNSAIPEIIITTDGQAAITSKDDYVAATIEIKGKGSYPDYMGRTRIKGRGNTTWIYPKKPYRLKLDAAAPLLGLAAEKDWVLLANYLDAGTLMLNAVSMKTAQLLDVAYANHMIPVDVILNGKKIGSYTLTEQIEADKNRVNVGENGQLLELDINYDEEWKFKSKHYQLPVMVKHPELVNSTELEAIKADFEALESRVAASNFPNNDYLSYLDAKAFAKYFVTYTLADNEELNHPKSTYMHKVAGGKYIMGPVWDFDWAFGYEEKNIYFDRYDLPIFWTGSKAGAGTAFFSRIVSDPKIKAEIRETWQQFRQQKFAVLMKYITDYAQQIKASQNANYQVWRNSSGNFDADVTKLKNWVTNRANFMDGYFTSF